MIACSGLYFLILVPFLFQPQRLFAQEMPDYRTKKESLLKLREKDIRSDIAIFSLTGIVERTGRPPLQGIPPKGYNDKQLNFEGNNVRVTVIKDFFDPEKHKLAYEEKYVAKIDKKPFYGSLGSVPQTSITGITMLIGTDTVAIPPAAYADLHNPAFFYRDASGGTKSLNGLYFSPDGRKIYIYLLSRNGSNSYEVTWIIQDKVYLKRVLDYDLN